jgi:hypothetical protein
LGKDRRADHDRRCHRAGCCGLVRGRQ